MYTDSYPTFDEIKEEISKEDLIEIMESAMSLFDGDINEAIKNFIETEYEAEGVLDIDHAYNCFRDNLLTA